MSEEKKPKVKLKTKPVQPLYKIDIVEFYPYISPKYPIHGSVHFYIEDLDFDFKGWMVIGRGKYFRVWPPVDTAIDEETGKRITFPVFSMINREKKRAFLNLVTDKVKAFLNTWKEENPEKWEKMQAKSKHGKTIEEKTD